MEKANAMQRPPETTVLKLTIYNTMRWLATDGQEADSAKVLMLDEPTSGLAPIVIRTIYDAVAQLRDRGLAILIVEQSVPRALANSSRCYVMERGRIVISGESTTLAQDEHVFAIVRGTEEVPSPARTS
jgi:ABC-type lipopolysaccharide export system ATPase subunit